MTAPTTFREFPNETDNNLTEAQRRLRDSPLTKTLKEYYATVQVTETEDKGIVLSVPLNYTQDCGWMERSS